MVEEATSLRQRVIDDLARRRELLTGQLEELRTGRDELLDAYRIVKRTFLEATEALAQVEARATAGASAARCRPGRSRRARSPPRPRPRAPPDSSPPDAVDRQPTPRPTRPSPPTAESPEAERRSSAEPTERRRRRPPNRRAADDRCRASTEPDEPEATTLLPERDPTAPTTTADLAPNLADVDDLFARLRAGAPRPRADAEQPAAIAPRRPRSTSPTARSPGSTDPEAAGARGSGDAGRRAADDVPEWLARRDEALAPLRVALVRQVKLAIGNEQNEVLDKVRRHKGRLVAASALPEVDAQTDGVERGRAHRGDRRRTAWAGARTAPPAATAGDATVPDDLASDLARAMVEPLRDRLVATIDAAHEPGETSNQVAERIGARYREWKNRSAESSADDALVAAYARGHYDAAADGAVLTW